MRMSFRTSLVTPNSQDSARAQTASNESVEALRAVWVNAKRLDEPTMREINDIVHAAVAARGGSISAEHGIGQLKRAILPDYKSPLELRLMHQVKQALDPRGLMNPGKLL